MIEKNKFSWERKDYWTSSNFSVQCLNFLRLLGPMIAAILAIALLGIARWFLPERSLDDTGPRAVLDPLFALGLLTFILMLAGVFGLRILRLLRIVGLSDLEKVLFSMTLGLGGLAYGVLALGLIGLLETKTIILWLLLAALLSWCEWGRVLAGIGDWRQVGWDAWRGASVSRRILALAVGAILILALIRALAPPTDYDGLMYHLEGPRLFLESRRIFPSTAHWWIDMPFAVEMLFTIGLSLGSETFPKLLHLSMAVLLMAGAFALARRLDRATTGWWTIFVLAGIPILPTWAIYANIDFGWALFEFAGFFAVLLWMHDGDIRWLALAGALSGFALGSKYLAVTGVAALGVIIILYSLKQPGGKLLRDLLAFSLTTVLIASPWYLKNWFWLGDPLFPFFGGGARIDPARLANFMHYTENLGRIDHLSDWFLLPIKIYTAPGQFSEILPAYSIPSLAFPLLLLIPFLRREKAVSILFVWVLIRFLLWAITSRGMRYLLPIYPGMAVLVGYVTPCLAGGSLFQRPVGRAARVLIAAMVGVTLLLQINLVLEEAPLPVIAGVESKNNFLERQISTYSAVLYAKRSLQPGSVMLTTGDGRTYYCRENCVQNDDQFLWLQLIRSSSDAREFEEQMKRQGFSYLLVSQHDLDYFLEKDHDGTLEAAVDFLEDEVLSKCGTLLYQDPAASIYKIACKGI